MAMLKALTLTTPDGVRLDADGYWPEGEGPFPVLLMRQPYGRAIASTVVYGHPQWYADQGYIVVIQDVRGRGTSTGEFSLFAHEEADGYATVQWAAQLPGSNGRVGMYGFSYQGMTQLFAAQAAPPALVTIAPAMVGYHPRTDWAYEQGVPLLQGGVGWALQLAAETARRRGDGTAFHALRQGAQGGFLGEADPARPGVLATHAPESFWWDWLAHPQAHGYWSGITPDLSRVDLPMLQGGGWFDPYLRGDLRLYQERVSRNPQGQGLWIGPWGHLPWGRFLGDRDFGPQAVSPMDQVQVRWFDYWLKGEGSPLDRAVNLFCMGENHWRSLDHWPTPTPQVWHLTSTGNAAMDPQAGQLCREPDPTAKASALDYWVHDPWRPVPSRGGHAAIPAGPYRRADLDDRSDVLTYTRAPLPRFIHPIQQQPHPPRRHLRRHIRPQCLRHLPALGCLLQPLLQHIIL